MKWLIREKKEQGLIEIVIDTRIFSKDIVIDTAYSFLDKWYFFFYFETDSDLIVQYRAKRGKTIDDFLLLDFYDALLEFSLREKLELENRIIRETIVKKAIEWPLDIENFVSFDTSEKEQKNSENFDEDIDAILKEIENTPELQIDEAEIERILKEIEKENQIDLQKPSLTINVDALRKSKQEFKEKGK